MSSPLAYAVTHSFAIQDEDRVVPSIVMAVVAVQRVDEVGQKKRSIQRFIRNVQE
jgi:hypothetical protein